MVKKSCLLLLFLFLSQGSAFGSVPDVLRITVKGGDLGVGALATVGNYASSVFFMITVAKIVNFQTKLFEGAFEQQDRAGRFLPEADQRTRKVVAFGMMPVNTFFSILCAFLGGAMGALGTSCGYLTVKKARDLFEDIREVCR